MNSILTCHDQERIAEIARPADFFIKNCLGDKVLVASVSTSSMIALKTFVISESEARELREWLDNAINYVSIMRDRKRSL